MPYLLISLAAYLAGTFPSALFMVRMTAGIDIRQKGTGNIGAMNSYDITRKKWVGMAVFLLDALKGLAAVVFARLIANGDFAAASISCFFVVLGHNYNIFLKFKGGRGLAAAVGGLLLINPLLIILWAIGWALSYFIIKRNVHIANTIATLFSLAAVLFMPVNIVYIFMTLSPGDSDIYIILSAFLSLLILLRHIQPLKDLIEQRIQTP